MEPLSFQEKVDLFNTRMVELQKEYGLSLYAANIVLKNGEVVPMVRVALATTPGITTVNETNENESNTKSRVSVDKKTQKNSIKK